MVLHCTVFWQECVFVLFCFVLAVLLKGKERKKERKNWVGHMQVLRESVFWYKNVCTNPSLCLFVCVCVCLSLSLSHTHKHTKVGFFLLFSFFPFFLWISQRDFKCFFFGVFSRLNLVDWIFIFWDLVDTATSKSVFFVMGFGCWVLGLFFVWVSWIWSWFCLHLDQLPKQIYLLGGLFGFFFRFFFLLLLLLLDQHSDFIRNCWSTTSPLLEEFFWYQYRAIKIENTNCLQSQSLYTVCNLKSQSQSLSLSSLGLSLSTCVCVCLRVWSCDQKEVVGRFGWPAAELEGLIIVAAVNVYSRKKEEMH